MKIKEIAKICKRSGRIILYRQDDGTQWLGDESALYPVEDLPELNESILHAIFDFTEKEKEKILFHDAESIGVCLSDDDTNEILLSDDLVDIIVAGRELKPFATKKGIVFIKTDYLRPLRDMAAELNFYERLINEENPYIAVKMGMLLAAVIMPFDTVSEEFVKRMEVIAGQCKTALENKTRREEEKGER